MLEPAARPQPDTDLDRRGQLAPHERIALATAICQERGVQMTELLRGTLELLWANRGRTSAYQLMERSNAELRALSNRRPRTGRATS